MSLKENLLITLLYHIVHDTNIEQQLNLSDEQVLELCKMLFKEDVFNTDKINLIIKQYVMNFL